MHSSPYRGLWSTIYFLCLPRANEKEKLLFNFFSVETGLGLGLGWKVKKIIKISEAGPNWADKYPPTSIQLYYKVYSKSDDLSLRQNGEPLNPIWISSQVHSTSPSIRSIFFLNILIFFYFLVCKFIFLFLLASNPH